MHYVYLIRSITFPKQKYIGQTDDIRERLYNHNHGCSKHTTKYKPWKLVVYMCFESKEKAIEFEKYLKSGSGRSTATPTHVNTCWRREQFYPQHSPPAQSC